MTIINEELARRNKENHSFSDYKAGTATKEYNEIVQAAAEKIERAKENVSDEAKERLDRLLVSYSNKIGNWINNHNSNGSGHVSMMLAGPSNYNMRRHEKWLAREEKLMKEYQEISDIESQISKIVCGDKIIKSGDSDAIQKLKEKLENALKEHESYKEHNKTARKEGKPQLPPYVLQNSNGRIKAIKDRLAKLEKEKAIETKEIEINDIKVIDNTELSRIQIIFPNIPDAEIRSQLKKNGFKWAPSQGAWQNFRNKYNMDKAKAIIGA